MKEIHENFAIMLKATAAEVGRNKQQQSKLSSETKMLMTKHRNMKMHSIRDKRESADLTKTIN